MAAGPLTVDTSRCAMFGEWSPQAVASAQDFTYFIVVYSVIPTGALVFVTTNT